MLKMSKNLKVFWLKSGQLSNKRRQILLQKNDVDKIEIKIFI